jgi:hypothetical protein
MFLELMGKVYRHTVSRVIEHFTFPLKVKRSKNNHKLQVALVNLKKEPLNVLFFVVHEAVWKLDSVYKKMESDELFNPTIIICPYIVQGAGVLERDMQKAYNYFVEKGYNVEMALTNNGEVINIRESFSPDVIFFTNPHDLTYCALQAKSFMDVLSVYVPYSHQVSKYGNYQPQYNQLFHNLMWKIFTTNELDKHIFKEFSYRKGDNVVVSGYPGVERLFSTKTKKLDVWKKQDKVKKKIIYAPHHTIASNCSLGYSTFLKYAEEIQKLSMKYKNEVQFAFKPHPLLKDKLADANIWGEEKTRLYFNFWQSQCNTQLEDGEYIDLFLQSDAIIHDSGSFLAEYLYVNKPSMYLFSESKPELPYNPFGLKCLGVYDKAFTVEDIENFILSVVIHGKDRKIKQREAFIYEHLKNSNGVPSDIIINHLKTELRSNNV